VKLAVKERERESESRIIFIKKIHWEATMLPNTLGSTVDSQQEHINLGYLLWGDFCEFL